MARHRPPDPDTLKDRCRVRTPRTPLDFSRLDPKEDCHKCGGHHWESEAEVLTWKCTYCGNQIFYAFGALKQQIDILLASGRGEDYVHNAAGTAVVPKKDAGLKKLRLREKLGTS